MRVAGWHGGMSCGFINEEKIIKANLEMGFFILFSGNAWYIKWKSWEIIWPKSMLFCVFRNDDLFLQAIHSKILSIHQPNLAFILQPVSLNDIMGTAQSPIEAKL